MAIKVTRNAAGNCINFVGSSQPSYWNSCLSAQVNATDSTRLDIINDIQTASLGVNSYEFYAMPFTDFAEADGTEFLTVQDAVNYITSQANVLGVSDTGTDMTGIDVNFRLDETSTSIILDNGTAFGVNTIKAVANVDGTIHIHAIGAGNPDDTEVENERKHLEKLEVGNIYVQGTVVSGGAQTIANTLNELFTVGPFESVIIADPFSTLVADVGGIDVSGTLEGDAIDPTGADIGAGLSAHYNKAGYKSTDTINEAGEYFTFDIRNEGIMGFGLILDDVADVNGNATYGDPAAFCTGTNNSGNYGFQASHWFHPSPDGPWTNYGANPSILYGTGWNGSDAFRYSDEGLNWRSGTNVKMKVGLDENGFIAISYLDVSTGLFVLVARTSYPVADGVKFHLGIKFGDSVVRLVSTPKVHLLVSAAPTMNFRYIESPDGEYDYPLFATAEEAEYYDLNHSGTVGTGTYTQVLYVDDPTFTQWYKADTGFSDNSTSAPTTGSFLSNPINWTEITSVTDADLIPSSFSFSDVSFTENFVVNMQVIPAGAGFSTTVTGLPTGLSLVNSNIEGTTRYVAAEETHTVTITRTNSYGSTSSSFVMTITHDSVAADIAGWTEYGADRILQQPNVALHYGGNFNADFNSTLSPGEEMVWTQTATSGEFMQMGIVTSGVDKSTTVLGDTTTNWDLKLTNWTTTVNHAFATGWTDNTQQSTGNNNGIEFRLKFPTDNGVIELYRDDVLLLTSSANYTGAQTITVAVPESYNTTTYLPTMTNSVIGAGTTTAPTGFNSPLEAGQMSSTTVMGYVDDSVAELTAVLGEGKRMIMPKAWVEANILPHMDGSGEQVFFGIPKTSADWTSVSLHDDFDAVVRWTHSSVATHQSTLAHGGNTIDSSVTVGSLTNSVYDYGLEWDGTDLHVIACNLSSLLTEPGVNSGGTFSRTYTYSAAGRTGDLPVVFAVDAGGEVSLNVSGISVIDIPAVAAGLTTSWDHAVAMSGTTEHMYSASGSNSFVPMAMAGYAPSTGHTSPAPTGYTMSSSYPWASAGVFHHTSGSNSELWGIGEGYGLASSGKDVISLRISSGNQLKFIWGRAGEYSYGSSSATFGTGWYGIYVEHDGTRYNGQNNTTSRLDACLHFKLVDLSTGVVTDIPMSWGLVGGGRMTRTVESRVTLGRPSGYSNTSNQSKHASFVQTTLESGVLLPTDGEVSMMVRDPIQWMTDYKVGNSYRRCTNYSSVPGWSLNDLTSSFSTHVCIMGDGTSDAYSFIRNQAYPAHSSYTGYQMSGMVSADIETVTITGLT